METATDPKLEDQIRGILGGQGSARELMHSEAFNRVLDGTLPAAIEQFTAMSEEERRRLADQGDAEALRFRSEPPADTPGPTSPMPAPSGDVVVPGTRKPNRDRVVTPDEDDADDEYFRERHQRGWLQ